MFFHVSGLLLVPSDLIIQFVIFVACLC